MNVWQQRWDEGRIGFHRLEANDALVDHFCHLDLPIGSTVMVPLCGKSLDMHWLAEQGLTVVGIDMVEKAVLEFFQDSARTPHIERRDTETKYSSVPFHLYHADFFEVHPDEAPFEAWYDRAAMVALPSSIREAYVEQLVALTSSDAKGLMITFDYPQHEMQGPPFALPDSEVESLFSPFFEIQRLQFTDLTLEEQREFSRCSLSVFLLTRR